ncbi:ABC transporter permease [Salipiger sp. CCB-MM3]|uniref:ABC transporter permease n=1 Tax=Salipiger sp. CCB-MM3 TaxID=1792508 RepID=UPI001EEE6D1E|nr:ABC transporter permease [Salipiger sp. CCB-MM3]
MLTRYGRSPGGYLWAVLEPLGMIAIMAIGFSLLLRTPPLGNSFLLFFATGHIPFALHQTISNTTARSLKFSKSLLSYPIITWVDAIVARLLLNALTGVLVAYLILGIVLVMHDDPIALSWPPIIESMLLTLLVGLGVGTLNCALFGLFPIWDQIWSIITRPLFIASGVLILYESMPAAAQSVLWFNPLIHITALMRKGFFPSYEAHFVSTSYVVTVGLTLLFMGVVLLGRYHRQILNA